MAKAKSLSFSDSYLSLFSTKNSIVIPGDEDISTNKAHWQLGYRYFYRADWLLGVGGGYKIFKHKPLNEKFAMFTLYQEANRLIRLFHPHYLFLGFRLLYMLPVQKAMFPMKKFEPYQQEAGIGINCAYTVIISDTSFLDFRLERWRGTNTMKFHGLEMSVGYNRSI